MPSSVTGHPWQWYGGRTYAQHGEDLILLNIFKQVRIERPSYLDIGAHDPFVISNTALLYERGSRGINVDANPLLIEAFKKHRPDDTNLAIGVAPEAGHQAFYMLSDRSGLNTFVPGEIAGRGKTRSMEIETTTVNSIVQKHADGVFPNILSIDAEGLDMAILRSIDFSASHPDVVIAETRGGAREASDVLAKSGFYPIFRAGSNAIFLHEAHRRWLFA